jgi:O-6-methylguanine DNA methyltransferase
MMEGKVCSVERVVSVEKVYWDGWQWEGRNVFVGITERGVVDVMLGGDEEAFHASVRKRVAKAELVWDEERVAPLRTQLDEYWQGEREEFDVALDLRGTEFQKQVWGVLQGIPFGKTMTYLEVAQAIGKPQAVRAVGAACGANPVPVFVPCHRVIGKNGKLTGFTGGIDLKERMLRLEGNLL